MPRGVALVTVQTPLGRSHKRILARYWKTVLPLNLAQLAWDHVPLCSALHFNNAGEQLWYIPISLGKD
jgi:hypothetical protein